MTTPPPDKAVERLTLVGHARDMENYLSGALLERPNFNATKLLGQLADAIEDLESQLAAQSRALEELFAAWDELYLNDGKTRIVAGRLDRAIETIRRIANQETIHYHRTGNPSEREWSDKFGRHFQYSWQAPDGRIFSRIITSDPIVGWTVTWDECRKSVMDAAALASVKQASGEGGE